MKKSQEFLVGEYGHVQVFNYTYYFNNKEEFENYQLEENERILEWRYTPDGIIAMNVEDVRVCKRKSVCEASEYEPFIKNLQKTQYNFNHNNEWYNNWIDYINKKPYDEACSLIELMNEFYVAGKENVW